MKATISEKVCTRCKTTRPLDNFPPNPSRADGKQSYCHDCNADEVYRRRQEDPVYRARSNAQRNAYARALQQLRDMHRDDFDRLYDEELVSRGLRSVGPGERDSERGDEQ